MKITGELLKSERIKKDLSVQDIAYSLKLNVKTIAALESGDLTQLPAKTFVRGFVKSYADYLKIDSDRVLRQFQEEMGSTRPMPKRPPPQATDQATAKKVELKAPSNEKISLDLKFNRNHIFAFAIVFLLVLVISVVTNKISQYEKETLHSSATSIIQPAPAEKVIATETQQEPPANQNVEKTAPVDSSEVVSAVQAIATTLPQKPEVAKSTYEQATPSNGKPVEILIEAKKEISIEYAKGNNTQFTTIKMLPQTFQIIRSTSGLHLRVSEGSAINLTVNGVLKGPGAAQAVPTVISF